MGAVARKVRSMRLRFGEAESANAPAVAMAWQMTHAPWLRSEPGGAVCTWTRAASAEAEAKTPSMWGWMLTAIKLGDRTLIEAEAPMGRNIAARAVEGATLFCVSRDCACGADRVVRMAVDVTPLSHPAGTGIRSSLRLTPFLDHADVENSNSVLRAGR